MLKTKKSSAQKGREKREAKILRLYSKLRGDYVRAMDLYTAIAEKAGCGYNKVIEVLQENNVITPKKKKQ